MEPSALKSLVSKINILPHLTKKATAEQHEIKGHINLNRGSKWHLREKILPLVVNTCLFRRFIRLRVKTFIRDFHSQFEFREISLYLLECMLYTWSGSSSSMFYQCKEKEALKSHNCVLIYKSETEGDENRTPDRSLIGLTTKMLKVKRLEEFNTCYNSNQLEKMAFFQCREEVEKVKCFLGENSGDQDSRSEQNEAKEKLWSDAGLAERMPVQSKRTSALAERSTQKSLLSSEKGKVNKFNKKNPEKTSASLVHRSFAIIDTERQDKVEAFAPRNSVQPRENIDGKDMSCTESLNTQESGSAGNAKQATVDRNQHQVSEEEENGFHSKEDTRGKEDEKKGELAIDVPAPPAPFDHRIVTAKQAAVNSFYTVSKTEILGGGRFGQVHKCEETATGLKLAAKIIKTRGMKDKEEVKNEISVMNQLDHANLIQLYDAFESKNDIVLVMEYVDGGELFDRIIDENYNLTELDTILFMKQICEGIRHMHQMYILHLDLKPENILCVSRDAKQIKIIDFGLARRYKPREKLKVNFGTPEFLAPEVVNYDFVSFPTDMWSVGVIAYMLLSGLSPFLGDNDAETLNNILACRWDLEDEEFQDISDEAKEFISKLLIKEKSWRISASEALKHPWLSDHKLHSRLNAQKKKKNRVSDVQDFVTK
uniref:Myosin light chain kinase family member 4 n=1 Tax=Callithrix jacchus TaxID=9483 RepID=A0A8I3W002_CALJA